MHAPHPLQGTMLPGGVGRLFTCSGCGTEFAGSHKETTREGEVTAVHCRDCRPLGFDAADTTITPDDLRRMAAEAVPFVPTGDRPPALTKTYGDSVFDPRWGDGEPRYPDEYDAHAQAEVRGRVKRRLTTVGGREL